MHLQLLSMIDTPPLKGLLYQYSSSILDPLMFRRKLVVFQLIVQFSGPMDNSSFRSI
jgi:hypothetical protein